MSSKSNKSRYLFLATIAALLLGGFAGVMFGSKADVLGDVSKLVIQALKAVAIPLLFVAIIDAFGKSHMSGRGFSTMISVSIFNSTVAITIGLLIVNIFRPGQYLGFLRDSLGQTANNLAAAAPVKTDWHKAVASFVPDNFVEPFLAGSTPAIIMLAIALGIALRRLSLNESSEVREGASLALKLVNTAFSALITMIGWVVYLVPLAVFCAVAKAVGKSGLEVAGGLGIFVLASIGGMLIQIFVTYQGWVLFHPQLTLRKFWSAAKHPAAYSFGINSSLATMPMTLLALDQVGIKPEAARLSACVGTNFNNDGILLYEVVAALILAQAFGQDLTLSHQLYVAFVSVAATLGVAGFPEAGVVALTLVLSAIDLPTEAIVLLMSVDWIIARSRSAANVLGDMAVAVAIDRFLPTKQISGR